MEPLRLDFGGVLASKIDAKTRSKLESMKNQKIDFRIGEGSIFKGQGAQKSMKNRCQNGFKIRAAFKRRKNIEKPPNIGPSWSQKSIQVAPKNDAKNRVKLKERKRVPE